MLLAGAAIDNALGLLLMFVTGDLEEMVRQREDIEYREEKTNT